MEEIKKNFLYGASIQGIQNFILQTDELKDIVGASELVEKICTEEFNEYGTDDNKTIVKAAGNIKYIFTSKTECEKAVLEFPKKVMELAPGITVSQAVVGYNSEAEFGEAIDELEQRLKAQRNKQQSIIHSFMGMRKSRQTGKPVEKEKNGEYLDAGTIAKRNTSHKGQDNPILKLSEKCFGNKKFDHDQIAYNIEEITSNNDWIAIIHGDGNGLGQVVHKVGKDKISFREFSIKLDEATKEAAIRAYNAISDRFDTSKMIPIRPVVLGGDDFTVICRADFALEYTQKFLEEFEKATNEKLAFILTESNVFKNNEDKLTACAGIAFIKSSYPFHYGYHLAEELCKQAKNESKKGKVQNELTQSCLMFHKVQDSFIEDFNDIERRELTAINGATLKYGPYFISNQQDKPTIRQLIENVKLLDNKEGNAVKSHLREWLSDMMYDAEMAQQKLERIKSNLKNKKELNNLVDNATGKDKIAAYDILSLHSVMYNLTKEEKDHDKH
jgi:hypothetical protein